MLVWHLLGHGAAVHHLTNVLLHAASAVLLFLVLRRMTGRLWPSALVAAIFAVHPLRAESVAWVTERKDVLSGLLFMLTLAAYLGVTCADRFHFGSLSGRARLLHPEPGSQAHGGHPALPALAAGLLAAGTDEVADGDRMGSRPAFRCPMSV